MSLRLCLCGRLFWSPWWYTWKECNGQMATRALDVRKKNQSEGEYFLKCSTLQIMEAILPESECWRFVSPCVRMRWATMSISRTKET